MVVLSVWITFLINSLIARNPLSGYLIPMNQSINFSGHLLIAMPNLMDKNFHHTVTLICEHNNEGALGIIINRSGDLRLGEIFDQMALQPKDPHLKDMPVYIGGPVSPERGFVLHKPIKGWDATIKITDEIGVTTSRDILNSMAEGSGPERSLIALGYAGWGAGQLEKEMSENAWLSVPLDEQILFDLPSERRWEAAATLLGVDLRLLSAEVGHA